MARNFDDYYSCEQLPVDIQAAATLLGFTKKELRENDEEPDKRDDVRDLALEQQEAATKLGYGQVSWDKNKTLQ